MSNARQRMAPWTYPVAWIGLIVAVIGAAGMLLSGPLYRAGALDLRPAFSLMGWGAKIGLAALLIGIVALVLSLMTRHIRGRAIAVVAIVLGLLAFTPPWMFRNTAASVPPIHDISTDTTNPPVFEALLSARSSAPNPVEYGGAQVASQQHTAYPDIKPLHFKLSAPQVFDAALTTATDMGWKIAAHDASAGRIEATDTTFWYGFKDDVVIRIRAENSTETRLDIRSLSRVGKSDVGKNADRIRTFEKRLRKSMP